MSKGGTFEEWYASKSERMQRQKEREDAAAQAVMDERSARNAKGAVAFKGWVMEVSVHDRALELIPQLNGGRFADEEQWKEAGIVLSFIDIGILEGHKIRGSDPHANPNRSMEHMFAMWSRKNHSFDSVTISANLAKRFTRGARSMFEESPEGNGNFVVGGIGYALTAKIKDPVSGFAVCKPLSSDDKLRNGIFNSMVKKAWTRAYEEAQSGLSSEAGDDREKRQRVAMARGLNRLSAMVLEDEANAKKKDGDDYATRREIGRAGHARWLELKDKARIKLPPQAEDDFKEEALASMDCSAPKGVHFHVPKVKKPTLDTSADMARRMGIALKTGYAYALNGSLQDLEASRKKLAKEGWVFLENFADPETGLVSDEGRAAYEAALTATAEGRAKKAADKKAKDEEAFWAWVETKEGSELAREVMSIMPVALSMDNSSSVSGDGAKGGNIGSGVDAKEVLDEAAHVGRKEKEAIAGVDKPLLGRPCTDDEYELWRAVGYASKAIDRSLLPDWMRWSALLFSRTDCAKEWASFKPGNHEADMVVYRAALAEEERKKEEEKEAEDKALGIKPRPKIPVGGPPGAAGAADMTHMYKMPKAPEPEAWSKQDRARALKLLHVLSVEHRKLAKFRATAKNEKPPVLPFLRRVQSDESLPSFLHGHEGAVKRITKDLAIAEGKGLDMLGGTGVGSELVLTWFVGEDDAHVPPPLGAAGRSSSASRYGSDGGEFEEIDVHGREFSEGKAGEMGDTGVEGPTKLTGRMRAAAHEKRAHPELNVKVAEGVHWDPALPVQPPYVMVVETCGPAGGRKAQAGEWSRVVVDPPEAMPLLTSTPGSLYVPLSARAQGLGVTPPAPGQRKAEWERDGQRMRGTIRLVGLQPNTSYCFRVRAYSRAGASAYTFGVFTTAAAPPPAPLITFPSLVPRHLLSVAATGSTTDGGPSELAVPPCDMDAITLCWERRIDLRTGMLRLLRLFFACILSSASGSGWEGGAGTGREGLGMEEYVDVEEDDGGSQGSYRPTGRPSRALAPADLPSTLFTSARASRTSLLRAVQAEVGLRNWLASCIASVDVWPTKEGATLESEFGGGDSSSGGSNFRRLPARFKIALNRPVSVLEALVLDIRSSVSWDDVTALFESDVEADDAFDLLLAGTSLGGALGLGDSSGAGALGVDKPDRPLFSLSGGKGSVISIQKAALKNSMTAKRDKQQRPLSAGGAMGSGLPPAGASFRPSTAAAGTGRGGGAGDLTAQLALMRTRRRGSVATQASNASSTAAKAFAASLQLNKPSQDVSIKYSLLQCVSDGPRGQEWQEVFVGLRSIRRLDKLMHGTSYCFKVQAVNQDGQGSLFGPAMVLTTAIPAPTSLRMLGRVSATSCVLAWDEVSAANPLSTMRAIAPPTGGEEGGEGGDVKAKGADIDAVLSALLARTKSAREAEIKAGGPTKKEAGAGGDDSDTFASVASSLAIREGDGGVGVDLMRVWCKYDEERTGFVPAPLMRGLLADLGAYSETAALVNAALDPGAAMHVASGEGAASAGPGEWRLYAALSSLDPNGTGSVAFSDFVEWWNNVDAAIAKAKGVSLADQLEIKQQIYNEKKPRPGSATGSVQTTTTAAGARDMVHGVADALHRELGLAVEVGDLSFAVVYVLEVRRLLTKAEAASVAAGGAVPAALKPAAAGAPAAYTRATLGSTAEGGEGVPEDMEEGVPEDLLMAATGRTTATRPATTASRAGSTTSLSALPTPAAIAAAPLYTAWSVIYIGPETEFGMKELLPNAEYQYRVSALGRHSNSIPSKMLTVNMPPLAPFAPVLIKTDPRAVQIRWYPGELGADKFEVQVKCIDLLKRVKEGSGMGVAADSPLDESSRLRTAAGTGTVALTPAGKLYSGRNVSEAVTRRMATARTLQSALALGGGVGGGYADASRPRDAGEAELWMEHPEEAWATLYTGAGTFASLTGMYANAVYHMRVLAYNAAGVPSRPSPETQIITAEGGSMDALTVANASRMFVVELPPAPVSQAGAANLHGRTPIALQDVVVGDTILFTEDVFVDSGPEFDPFHPEGPKEVPESHARAQFYCSRTVAAVVLADTASLVTTGHGHSANIAGPGGPVPVGATATAFAVSGYLHALKTEKLKSATGRLVTSVRPASAAARRKHDAGVGVTDSGVKHIGTATSMEDALHGRTLSLQVEFSTVSKTRAGAFAYPHGTIIKRVCRDLLGLDMFRTMWEDEGGRWSLAEEMRASYDR